MQLFWLIENEPGGETFLPGEGRGRVCTFVKTRGTHRYILGALGGIGNFRPYNIHSKTQVIYDGSLILNAKRATSGRYVFPL